MMNRPTLVLAVLTALSAAACAGAASDDSEAGAGAIATEPTVLSVHGTAVKACETRHDATLDTASTTGQFAQAEVDRETCIRNANDGSLAAIETNLKQAGSSHVGTAAVQLEKLRGLGEDLCAEADKALAKLGGKAAHIEAAVCRAKREVLLAALLDKYVALGAPSVAIPPAREAHAACYAAFDKAEADAVATTEEMQAAFGLASCIASESEALAGAVAKIQVENDASHGDLAAATARVRSAASHVHEASDDLCATLTEAGENGTGGLSGVATGHCQAHLAAYTHATLSGSILP